MHMKKHLLTDLLYPPRCVFCQSLMQQCDMQICKACKQTLTPPQEDRKGNFFKVCISALPYEDTVRSSIIRMKLKNRKSYIKTYGKLLAEQIRQKLDGKYDVITWVPISWLRKMQRGYDQDRLIAEAVAEELSKPIEKLLLKTRHTRRQSSIRDVAQRRSNVLNTYRCVSKEAVTGKRILLIDDVITSGATLSECSKMLLLADAAQVVCATVATANKRQ